jgi:GNAT superfamily N-acetyltransferase
MQGRVAVAEDTDEIARTLAEAFFLDPVWSWAFDDRTQRKAQHEAWFRLLVHSALPYQWVWTTAGYEAATVWVPPGCSELNEADEALLEAMLKESLGARAELVFEVFDCFEAAHPRTLDHYYLGLLGTHTEHRGAGIGMHLLRENLVRLDDLGLPAYLESTNPANLERYEGVGFAVYEVFDLPDGGPTVTTMWRDPAT